MKRMIHTILVAVLGLSGICAAATPREATVRIIREADEQTAQTGEFPTSYTGCIISPDGYIVTTGACLQDNEEVKSTHYKVYLPHYDKAGQVQGVSAYDGTSVAKQDDLLLIRLQDAPGSLPCASLKSSDITEADASAAYIGMLKEPELHNLPSGQDVQAKKSIVRQIAGELAVAPDPEQTYFNIYMTSDLPQSVGATPNVSPGAPMQLRIGSGLNELPEGCKGAPIVSQNGKGDIIGIYVGSLTAKPAGQVLRLAANNNVSVASGFNVRAFLQENGVIIIVVSGVLMMVLIGLLVVMNGKSQAAAKAEAQAEAEAAAARPVITLIGQDGSRHPLTRSALNHGVTIGRSSSMSVRFAADDISRHHATLQARQDGKLFIVDHSSYGTYVNDEKITPKEPHKLRENDVIRLSSFKVTIKIG